jgi:hypothetical protein
MRGGAGSGVPFGMNTLWANRADTERIVNAAPGLF